VNRRLLPQPRVDLLQRGRARTNLILGEPIERRVASVEVAVQILGLGIEVEHSGDELAFERKRRLAPPGRREPLSGGKSDGPTGFASSAFTDRPETVIGAIAEVNAAVGPHTGGVGTGQLRGPRGGTSAWTIAERTKNLPTRITGRAHRSVAARQLRRCCTSIPCPME
jgi:hypothetical protein